jgi:predicted RNase H-like HicB family nuclease
LACRQYTIFPRPEVENGGYSVDVPTLPGCRTQGDSLEEATANAKEAIAAWIASAEAHGEAIPEETTRPQAIVVDFGT